NFSTGAVDNRYPLAHSHLDGAPAAQADATFADTGPLGQTVVGTYNGPNPVNGAPPPVPINQPQYVSVRYPPGTSAPQTFGSAGGPFASADASATAAHASATLASAAAPTGTSMSAAQRESLRAALNAWRAAWLNSREAKLYPATSVTDAPPDGTDVDTGISS